MDKKRGLLGFYDYTVILTYTGMICGFLGILMAVNSRFWDSVICLMLAGICDMFDGAVASTKTRSKREKRFGIQIDSMSDMVCFGVLPAIFLYFISDKNMLAGTVAAIYTLSALIRLSYFNVCEEERQETTDEKRTVYTGLPVTTVSVTLPAVYIILTGRKSAGYLPYLVLLVLSGAGFLSPFEVKKPNLAGKVIILICAVFEALGILFLGWDLV